MNDFTKKYNTSLPPVDEQQFQAWAVDESKRQGRNVLSDLYDYDLRGMWDAGSSFGGENGHATDQWKKPNHPTFSNQSIYSGTDGFQGGIWEETPQGQVYTASPTNTYSRAELQKYFDQNEPGVRAILDSLLR